MEVNFYRLDEKGQLFISPAIREWAPLADLGIDTVIDMDAGLDECIPTTPEGCLYIYFPIYDEALPNLRKLEAVAELGAHLIEGGHRVLSHCGMGFNRSALVAGRILNRLGMPGTQVVERLRERCEAIDRAEHEARLQAEEEARVQADIERRRAEERARLQAAEQARQAAEEGSRRREEDEPAQQAEDVRRRAQEEAQRRAEEAWHALEEARRRAEREGRSRGASEGSSPGTDAPGAGPATGGAPSEPQTDEGAGTFVSRLLAYTRADRPPDRGSDDPSDDDPDGIDEQG